jgi:3'(2'), 5'-bisphosphate nucleotidase
LDRLALAHRLVEVARLAGAATLEIYRRPSFEVVAKADASPVTEADLASQTLIIQHLREIAPAIPVLSEEAAARPFGERRHWKRLFIVDPLDGTREFVSRNGEFTINIALVEDGVPTVGAVFAPTLDSAWFGAETIGAFRQDRQNPATAIEVGADEASRELRVLASRSHRGERLESFLNALPQYRLVSVGSSVKFCRVAEGSADLYPRLSPTHEWDTAAGDAIVRAAGGQVLGLDGAPLRYNKEDLLNPSFVALGARAVPWQEAWQRSISPEGEARREGRVGGNGEDGLKR